jgi:glucan phosphoethanolaminetransferase (alkaline phosphatase superfamily)
LVAIINTIGGYGMYSNEPIVYKKDRRQRADIICIWLEVASFLVWIVLFVILLLYQNAMPREKMFFDRLLEVEIEETLDYSRFNLVFYLLVFLFVLSLVSLLLNFKRLKRKTDRIRISFIVSLVCSCIGIIIYFIYVLM